jgi:ComF family protein
VHPSVSCARSWCWADNVVAQPLIHALKYHGWHAAAVELAERMARLDLAPLPVAQRRILVPVPLSRGRERERGYNQSACLASALAQYWCTGPPVELLTRSRDTPTQTRLTPVQRLHNVASAFRVDARRLSTCGDAALILVDDVVTTGATLNACADALAGAGAHTICYITFGRARDPRDARPSRGTPPHGQSGRH